MPALPGFEWRFTLFMHQENPKRTSTVQSRSRVRVSRIPYQPYSMELGMASCRVSQPGSCSYVLAKTNPSRHSAFRLAPRPSRNLVLEAAATKSEVGTVTSRGATSGSVIKGGPTNDEMKWFYSESGQQQWVRASLTSQQTLLTQFIWSRNPRSSSKMPSIDVCAASLAKTFS